MAVISFNFTSIHADVIKPVQGKIKIGNNIALTSVEKADINFADTSKGGARIQFEYKSVFDPGIGSVVLKGNVVYLQEADTVKRLLDTWKKDKKVITEAAKEVMTSVLDKASVQALVLSREVGLPSPIPMPKVGNPAAAKKK